MTRKKRKKRKERTSSPEGQRQVEIAGTTDVDGRNPRGGRRHTVKGWRRWTFRFLALIGPPTLFFLLVEFSLRISGYGVPMSFTIRQKVNVDEKIVNNYFFSCQFFPFFPRDLARQPVPFVLPPEKDRETCRVFVLGGSAAQGFPDPTYGIAPLLEAMLVDHYPGVRFEVINAAISAINSHVVLPIARECSRLDSDLVVVYLGNNEVIGPYGAGTVLTPVAPSLSLIRSSLAMQSTRVGQLITQWVAWGVAGDAERPQEWRGMQMFLERQVRAGDPKLETTYRNFEANLQDICHVAPKGGVPVVVSTVAANLKDCPPFASMHRPNLSEDDLRRWDDIYRKGVALESEGRIVEASKHYEDAANLDGEFAELAFRRGRCFGRMGDFDRAREFYKRSRDLDTLRFRADQRINEIIRRVAEGRSAEGVYLVDGEKILAANSPHKTPGNELFYEHVHLRFAGTYLVARAVFEQSQSALPEWVRQRESEHPVLSEDECARRVAFTPLDLHNALTRILGMMDGPPFTNQLDHEKIVALRVEERKALTRFTSGEAFQEILPIYEAALRRENPSLNLRHRHATIQLFYGDNPDLAANEFHKLVVDAPHVPVFRSDLCQALSRLGRPDEVVRHCDELLGLDLRDWMSRTTRARAHLYRGDALVALGRSDEAIVEFNRAIELKPGYADAYCSRSTAHLSLGEFERAVMDNDRAIELESDYAAAYNNRGAAHQELGRLHQAIQDYSRAIELEPDNAMTYSNRGDTYLALREFDQAVPDFDQAIELQPDSTRTYHLRGIAHCSLGRLDQGILDYDRAIKLSANDAGPYFNRGTAYLSLKRFDRAVLDYNRAIEIKPDYAAAYCNRGTAYLSLTQFERAVGDFDRAIQLKPDYTAAYNNRAQAHFRSGAYDKVWSDVEALGKLGGTVPPEFLEALQKAAAADGQEK